MTATFDPKKGQNTGLTCAHPGCSEPATHRAPVDRTLSAYQWLCLEHVRAFNAAWNYHEGLTPEDMEQEYRSSATWDRPTWPLGGKPGQGPGPKFHGPFNDPFDMFDQDEPRSQAQNKNKPDGLDAALDVLELGFPFTEEELRTRYKTLVKENHPDRHGGCAQAEQRMKQINAAYSTLTAALDQQPAL